MSDPEKALNEERKRRWEASKHARAEARVRRLEEQVRRREAWSRQRQDSIVHAGTGVSGGLHKTASDVAALERGELPVLHTGQDVAARMGISLSSLRGSPITAAVPPSSTTTATASPRRPAASATFPLPGRP